MKIRLALVIPLALFCAQATLSATNSYSFPFGTANVTSSSGTPANSGGNTFDSGGGDPTYTAGAWTEDYYGTNTTTGEQIVCVVGLGLTTAQEANTCGNPGPGTAQHIGITEGGEPGNSSSLPAGTTNYLEIDGDPAYGAPVSTDLTGLTVGNVYQLSFYQASNEEDGSDKPYNDSWEVYLLPGAAGGAYLCPQSFCTGLTTQSTDSGDLDYTSPVMANNPPVPGNAVSTPWELETYNFVAANTSEVLEFVTNAVAVTNGGFAPPFLDLAGVTLTNEGAVPEPSTLTLSILGAGLVFAGSRLRRRSSSRK